jgi:hypothetical protein
MAAPTNQKAGSAWAIEKSKATRKDKNRGEQEP